MKRRIDCRWEATVIRTLYESYLSIVGDRPPRRLEQIGDAALSH